MNKIKTNIKLPLFNGFYTSIEESITNDLIEKDIEYYKETYDLDIDEDDVDYQSLRKKLVDEICDTVETMINDYLCIDFKIIKSELVSPKEYNFTTDKIYVDCEIDIEQLLQLVEYQKENLSELIETDDRYHSYSGYICFVSNVLDEWIKSIHKLDENSDIYISELIQLMFEENIVNEKSKYSTDYVNFVEKYIDELNESELQVQYKKETEQKIMNL